MEDYYLDVDEEMEVYLNLEEELEEMELIQDVLNVNRTSKVYVDHINPLIHYNNEKFREYYRLKKETARVIIDLVRDELNHINNRGRPVSPEIQFLAFIRYFAKGADQNEISEKHGFHQSTLSRIIKHVAEALAMHRNEFIKFPDTAAEISTVKRDLYALAGCPNIVGCIDETHMKIKCPTLNIPYFI